VRESDKSFKQRTVILRWNVSKRKDVAMSRISRLITTALCAMLPLVSSAATRICSVYVESYASLQKQLFLGAEVFNAPQLGAMPMMLTMSLPGAAQINPDQPVALHLFDVGNAKTGFIMELTPVGTNASAYLQAIIGNEDKLPVPVNGVYVFNGGAARVVGTRVLFAPKASDLAACAGTNAPALPPLPAIPGTIRVVAFPSALKPMISNLKTVFADLSASGMPNAKQTQQSMDAIIDFYGQLLGQIDTMQIGIAVQREGLAIRSRLIPTKDSDIATLLASAKPVTPEYLTYLDGDALFRCAAGSYTFPATLRKQIVDLYTSMMRLQPNLASVESKDIAELFDVSIRSIGAPLALTATCRTNAILVQGMMGMPQSVSDSTAAETYLTDQLAMMKKPVFAAIMGQSGMKMPEPVVRTYKDVKIHTFKTLLDEEGFKKTLRAQMPADLDPKDLDEAMQAALKPMRAMMKLLEPGYEYAAKGKTLAFGMGSPEMVEQVINRIDTPAKPSVEANRITQLLAPASAPFVIGRLSLSGIAKVILTLTRVVPAEAAAAFPTGDGVVMAEWITGGQAESAILITTSEITSLTAIFQAVNPSPGMGAFEGGDMGDDEDMGDDGDL
jgi:hypothetical protein